MALKNNELQEFLEAWVSYKKLINNNWKSMTVYTIKGQAYFIYDVF